MRGQFIEHSLTFFPYQILTQLNDQDPAENMLRNLMMFKLLRLSRLSTDFIPDDILLQVIGYFFSADSRDDKIANDKLIINNIKIVKQVLTTLMTTYFLALLWYRFSDYWQMFLDDETEDNYFVVVYGLRPPSYTFDTNSTFHMQDAIGIRTNRLNRILFEGDDWDMPKTDSELRLTEIHSRLITCMYYALTTLATVGYGDYSPCSISEKIAGSMIQLLGVSFFSVLMNNFIDVVLSMKSTNGFNDNEDNLQSWFILIKKIKNQPYGGNSDISAEMKDRIESHFRYFWDNDRTAVLY